MGNIQRDFTLNLGKERQPYISKARLSEFERYLLEEGDIVITLTDLSDTGKYLGTVARLPKGRQALLNQRVSKLRVVKSLDVDFLFYALQEPRFRAYMESDTTGTLQKNTNHEYIYRYSLVFRHSTSKSGLLQRSNP
jgi:type I restriction enzyme S subunit